MQLSGMKEVVKNVSYLNTLPEFRELPTYRRATFNFVGGSGTGKTHNIIEAGTELGIPVIVARFSQYMPEDFSLPIIDEEGGTNFVHLNPKRNFKEMVADMFGNLVNFLTGRRKRYTSLIADIFPVEIEGKKRRELNDEGEIVETEENQIDFERAKNYIANYSEVKEYWESRGLTINDAPGMIFFGDEINRIEDTQMFQMNFSLIDEHRFKNYKLPDGATIFTATNPADGDFIVQDWDQDDAYSSRFVHLKLEARAEDFLDYAEDLFGPVINTFASMYPETVFDEEKANAFNLPEVVPTPRNHFRAENWIVHAKKFGIDWTKRVRNELIGRFIGESQIQNFVEILEGRNPEIPPTPEEIIEEYEEFKVSPATIEFFKRPNSERSPEEAEEHLSTLFEESQNIKENNQNLHRYKIIDNEISGRRDIINKATDDLFEYIKRNAEDEKFIETFNKNRLRTLRFMMDINRPKFKDLMKKMVNHTPTSMLLLTSHDSSEDLTRSYINMFSDLVMYTNERLREEGDGEETSDEGVEEEEELQE